MKIHLLLVAVLFGKSLCAAPFIESYVGAAYTFDDNTFFSEKDKISDSASDLSAGLIFSNNTEGLTAQIEPSIRVHESWSNSSFNEVSPSLSIASHSQSERSTLGFILKVQKESTRISETVNADNSTASGIVVDGKNRLYIVASPSWLYRLTPRSSVSMTFTFSEADYNNATDVGLYDYDYQVLDARVSRSISERTEVWVGPTYGRYSSFESDSSSTTYGLNAGVDSSTLEKLNAGLRLGWVATDSEVAQSTDKSDLISSEAFLKYKWARGQSRFFYKYDISPTGTGQLNQTSHVGSDMTMKHNSLLDSKFSIGFLQRKDARSNPDNLTTEAFYVTPTIGFELARNSFVEFSLSYDSESIDGLSKERFKASIQYIFRPSGMYL
ncbi:MAG: hypothetical protein ACWA44_06765 [Thiotrichales bacterium]